MIAPVPRYKIDDSFWVDLVEVEEEVEEYRAQTSACRFSKIPTFFFLSHALLHGDAIMPRVKLDRIVEDENIAQQCIEPNSNKWSDSVL